MDNDGQKFLNVVFILAMCVSSIFSISIYRAHLADLEQIKQDTNRITELEARDSELELHEKDVLAFQEDMKRLDSKLDALQQLLAPEKGSPQVSTQAAEVPSANQ
jgi:peptidoglycan hydrolase CwlO-like protein